MIGMGTLGSVAATYLAPATERAVLERFYRTTKPFGLWGPLRRALPPDEAAAMAAEHKYDLISLPFAFFWQLTMLMLPMLLIIRQYGASAVTGAVLAVSLVGLYFFWYKKLPPR
jgi:hypothetical protein